MYILTYTLILLSIWTSLSYIQWQEIYQDYAWRNISRNYEEAQSRLQSKLAYEYFCTLQRPKRGFSKKVGRRRNGLRAPHVYESSFFQNESDLSSSLITLDIHNLSPPENIRFPIEKKVYEGTKGKIWMNYWSALLEELYGQQTFYIQAQRERKDLSKELLQALWRAMDVNKELSNKTSRSLASLDLQDDLLNRLWYKMVKGSDHYGHHYASILRYVWFKDWIVSSEPCKINILYAQDLLLKVFLGQEVAHQWFQKREELIAKEGMDRSFDLLGIEWIFSPEVMRNFIANEPNLSSLNDLISYKTGLQRKAVEILILEKGPTQSSQKWTLVIP